MNAVRPPRRLPPSVAWSAVAILSCGLFLFSNRQPTADPSHGPTTDGVATTQEQTSGGPKSGTAKSGTAKPGLADSVSASTSDGQASTPAEPQQPGAAGGPKAALTQHEVFNQATASVVAVYDDFTGQELSHGAGFIAIETLPPGSLPLAMSLRLSTTRKMRGVQNLGHYVCGVVVNGRLESSNLTVEFADARQSVIAVVRSVDEKRNLSFLEVHYLADAPYPALRWPEASPTSGDPTLGITVYQRTTRIMSPGLLGETFDVDGVEYWGTSCRVPPGVESGVLVDGVARVLGLLRPAEGPPNYSGPAIQFDELKAFVAAATRAVESRE